MFDHLILLRHGETADSAAGLFTGRRDVELSGRGRRQAMAWSDVLPSLADECWSSPLLRAVDTARLAGLVPQQRDSLLEWDMGSLEGTNAEEFRGLHPDWSLLTDGNLDGSGESKDQVFDRAGQVGKQLEAESRGVVVLVSHGQFLRVLATQILGIPQVVSASLAFGPARAGVITQRTGGRFALTGWNVPARAGDDILRDLT